MQFEWSEFKNRVNRHKHGIGFEEVGLVFDDPFALTVRDVRYQDEERWQTLGLIQTVLVLVVYMTRRDDYGEEIIRIISARQASAREARRYFAYRKG